MLDAKNVIIRAVSGAAYILIIISALIFGSQYFCLLCTLMAIWGIFEFNSLCSKKLNLAQGHTTVGLDVFGIICLTSIMLFTILGKSMPGLSTLSVVMIVFYIGYFLSRLCVCIFSKTDKNVECLAGSILGQIYIGCGIVSAQYLSLLSPGFVLLAFIYIWLNDTGAFLAGSTFGKHKLSPQLSPKKSWEGFIGGLVICILSGIVFRLTNIDIKLTGVNANILGIPNQFFIFPVVICLLSTLGDLFESLLKRSAKVKDSGNLIPGHGGLLDRIDSMLFVMPGLILCVFLINLMR